MDKNLDKKYLKLLAEKYPSAAAAKSEIINLTAIMSLPKGTEYFFSDIHGEYKKFKEILKYWDSNRQQLILLGDLCDRGLQSYECFYLAKYLCDNYGAILIKGNHEDLFLKFLRI